ncbi:hypothetical protein KY284_027095 [Solanum tuberosum]|nr:hypothetical protein KY284_027095 [Solanum tuberosum]
MDLFDHEDTNISPNPVDSIEEPVSHVCPAVDETPASPIQSAVEPDPVIESNALDPQPANDTNESDPPPTRRTARASKPHLWHKDYLVPTKSNMTYLYPIANNLSYEPLTPSYHNYSKALSVVVKPTSFKEASKHQQ